MTLDEPLTAVPPLIVPHQPASLKDLSSSRPTSVTPPILTVVPAFSSPQAAKPPAAWLAAALAAALGAAALGAAALGAAALGAAALGAVEAPPELQAAKMSAVANTAAMLRLVSKFDPPPIFPFVRH